MKLLLIAAALSALYLLEPRPVYLDGVAPRLVRYERVERSPISHSLIGGSPTTVVTLTGGGGGGGLTVVSSTAGGTVWP